jgi:alpha-2-macroglobulin
MHTFGDMWKTFFFTVRKILALLFGRCTWEPPAWLAWTGAQVARGGRSFAAHPLRAGLLALALMLAGGGSAWYLTRPKPHYVTYVISAPGLTEYNVNGIAAIKPLTIVFNESVAPLKQIKTAVMSGVDLSPSLAGTWFWTSDKELRFTPKDDWPVDGAFSVQFAGKGLLARQVQLGSYRFKFRSQPFSARVTDSQFYQDPRDPNLKKLVATVAFSHPVDAGQFESHVSLSVAKDAEYLGLTPDSRHFTVIYDKFKLAAHIHSAALAMPRDDTPMTVRIDKGVRAARGGNDTADRLEAVVTIPGRTSLRFSDARMTVVDNARYVPEQILFLKSSSPVSERAFEGKVSVHVLPERHPRQDKDDKKPYDWRDETEIGADILAKAPSVNASYVPADEGGDTSHGFKFQAPVGRYLYVLIKDGVEGTGGYISGKPFVGTIKVDPYPRALTFLGNGALLSLSGERKVGFLVRDVGKVQVEIGRVLPNQLQHLAPEMLDFSRPRLYGGLEDKVVERFVVDRDYSARLPGKPTYDSIDVGQYLQDHAQGRRGLFLLRLRATTTRASAGAADPEEEGADDDRALEDTRLILVTDLGFIVKRAKDGSREVFVQSIRNGTPVAGARVELVGSNGQPVLAATTDTAGGAHLPAPPQSANREHTPQMVVVQKDEDMSFMPFRSGGRDLDLSRYDTGGVESAKSAQQVSAYLFSDRGIYRPGETTHLGVIARTADWKASLAGLPLDVEITDARGLVVSRRQMTVSAGAFDELAYTSQASAPTGTYEAVAYLVKDERHREVLGTTTFRVQEFEPDRMKVQLELGAAPTAGWLRPADVKARITVAHLFGAPAGNRRVEGELSLTPVLPRFTRYPDHRFQIGEVIKEPYHEALAALRTDDKGTAEFNLDLKRFVGRAYRLNVLGRAFEAEGGRNVASQNSAIVADAAFLVGVKPDGELTFVRRASARHAQWLAVNQQLDPVAADKLTLEWVQRKFVSVLTQQSNGTFKYVSRLKTIVRNSRSVRIATGGSSFPLPTDEPGDFDLVLRDGAGAVLNTLSYSVAGQANLSRSLDRNAELQIQLDKPVYSGGDTIEVSIRAPYVGAGLITIERERVFTSQWFKTTTTSSVQRIRLPEDFEGNGYISVQFVRDPSSDELFMSPLSYGVAPFGANLAARKQTMTLAAPRQVRPGTTLTIHVAPGEASRVAVLAVDEGILQVARYKNPDPLGYFFQKRMLEVETSQILDLILPDFKRFLALAAPGGDAGGGFARHLNPFNRKRKLPVAY